MLFSREHPTEKKNVSVLGDFGRPFETIVDMKLTPGDVQLLVLFFWPWWTKFCLDTQIPSGSLWRFHQAIQSSTQLQHVTTPPLNSLQFRCSFQTGFPSTCHVWFPQPSHLDWLPVPTRILRWSYGETLDVWRWFRNEARTLGVEPPDRWCSHGYARSDSDSWRMTIIDHIGIFGDVSTPKKIPQSHKSSNKPWLNPDAFGEMALGRKHRTLRHQPGSELAWNWRPWSLRFPHGARELNCQPSSHRHFHSEVNYNPSRRAVLFGNFMEFPSESRHDSVMTSEVFHMINITMCLHFFAEIS